MLTKLKSLKNHQGFMKYFKNTSWLFGEKIFRIIVGLFVGIWVARYLGPEQFGLLSYAQSFVGLFTAIATLGLDGIVVRELVRDESKRDELIGTAFCLKLMGAFGVLFILAIAVNFTSNDHYTNILIFIIASATIFQSFNVIDMYFQSKVLSKYVVYANIISLFISSVVKIALILNDAPLIDFAWVVVFDSFILACGYVYFYLKQKNFILYSWKFDKKVANKLLRDSWPLIIASSAIIVYKRIDQVMLQNMLSSSIEVGYYAAAVQISFGFSFIPIVITKSVFPKFVDEINNSVKIKIMYLSINSFLFYIAFFSYLIIYFFSDSLISLLYGSCYKKTAYILVLHFIINIFLFIGVLLDKLLIVENKQINITYRVFLGVVVNIVLNYLLIPNYGAIGASYATIISQFFTSIVFLLLFTDSRKYFLWQFLSIFYPFIKLTHFIMLKRNKNDN
jgi:O-antigen/teichoic acid export membrane protein